MKKVYFLFLTLCVLTACNQHANSDKTTSTSTNDTSSVTSGSLSVAVVNVDSLLMNYTFAKNANETLIKKQEDARLNINTKARQLQNEMADFENKLNNNAFLSRERAEQEGLRIQNKQAELQELDRKLSNDLMIEQQNLSQQLQDSINQAIRILNENGRYSLILSTSSMNDNVLFMEEQYNITDEVLTLLNSRCK